MQTVGGGGRAGWHRSAIVYKKFLALRVACPTRGRF
jgi:hypothetical protein